MRSLNAIQKFWLTLSSSVLLVLFVLFFVFIPLYGSVLENIDLKKVEYGHLKSSISSLKASNKKLDHYLYNGTQVDFNQHLIFVASKSCELNKARLSELSSVLDENGKGTHKKVYKVSIKGDFVSLMKTVSAIQEQLEGGVLSSVHFQMSKDKKTKLSELTIVSYVQSISYFD